MALFPFAQAIGHTYAPIFTAAPTSLSITTGASAATSALSEGFYLIKSDVDFYIKQGTSSVSAASTDWQLEANVTYGLQVASASDNYVAGRAKSANGTVKLLKVG